MRLSEYAEKILLSVYKKDKGEKIEISSNSLKISPDIFDEAWKELEGNNENETVFVNGNIQDIGMVDDPCKKAINIRIYEAGVEYIKKFLEEDSHK